MWPFGKKHHSGKTVRVSLPIVRASAVIRSRYDAAQTTDENRRHWANADALSAAAANSLDMRRTVRNRARYEVANNCYLSGMVQTLANDCIGTDSDTRGIIREIIDLAIVTPRTSSVQFSAVRTPSHHPDPWCGPRGSESTAVASPVCRAVRRRPLRRWPRRCRCPSYR